MRSGLRRSRKNGRPGTGRSGAESGEPGRIHRLIGAIPFGRIARWTAVGSIAAIGVLAPRHAPPLLAEVEYFRAADVEVRGLRFLERDEVLRLAGIGPTTSVWEDLELLRSGVATHPLVRSVAIRRELPDRIVLDVVEREAVGLVPTPTLEPVDREGRYLPLDPARLPLDLPLLVPVAEALDAERRPSPVRLRMLARIAETLRAETTFWSRVSEVRETQDGVVAIWGTPQVTFQLGTGTDLRRLQQGVAALGDALVRSGERIPRVVDLRWADQVVIRYRDS